MIHRIVRLASHLTALMELRPLKVSLLLLVLGLLLPTSLAAQRIQTISGRVLDKESKKPFRDAAVFIYAFNTVAEAEDAFQILNSDAGVAAVIISEEQEVADQSGNYEIRVPDNGALIFKVDMSKPIMEKVEGRLEINVLLDAGLVLEDVTITGTLQDIKPTPKAPTMIGNKLILYGTFPIPAQFGKSNARLIIQPYVIDCETQDTIFYNRPLVYDGEEYRFTQNRRMAFDDSRDILTQFVQEEKLTEKYMSIDWNDTVVVPDPKRNYNGTATVLLEDYTQIYFCKSMLINTCEMKRPFKFLEFSFGQRVLNDEDYRERPKREKRNTSGNISLSFLVAKAELDSTNPENDIQLNKLKSDILEIINGEGTSLKEFHITGISSPEGSYSSNLNLAHRRVAFAQNSITSVIPKQMLARVYQNPQAKVAGWDQVAELLKDTLPELSERIQAVVNQSSNPDMQFSKISRMPEYSTVIKDVLPKLRTVKYEYKHEIFRELNPEEILHKYLNDADYRSGKKAFALYEYWHLFRMVKDTKELEELYKRAYRESEESNGQPWILAANNLAVSYLQRDTCDISILAPFIDKRTKGVNVTRTRMDGITREIINPEEVVGNQLAMSILSNDYEEASILAQILPNTPANEKMIAFARCLGGYFRGGDTPEERKQSRNNFDLVRQSSPINNVVMQLAMENRGNNALAEQGLKDIDFESPIRWYLKAIVENRKGDVGFEEAKNALIQCYKRDEKYITIAEQDGDIGKDLFEYSLEMYELEKEFMM
ncbi:MAG: hypothetical protein ACRCZZ_06990 [Phocaeicola sp.]